MPKPDTSLKGELLRKLVRDKSEPFKNESIVYPKSIYILPVSDRPFFPSQTLPMIMEERYWLEGLKKINGSKDKLGGLILANAKDLQKIKLHEFSLTGSLIRIHHPVRAAKKVQFIAEGLKRFRITEWLSDGPPYHAAIDYPDIAMDDVNRAHYKAYALQIINTMKEMMQYNPLYNEELKFFLTRFTPDEPSPLCDFAASLISSNKHELQSILDTCDLQRRMETVLVIAKKELEMVKIQAQIRQDVEAKISENQRKFFLKEQLKTIQKELGISKDDKTAVKEKFAEKIESIECDEKAKDRMQSEMDKFSILETGSPEYALTRNYLDVITNLPWNTYSEDNYQLDHAKSCLNEMHEGLEDIKQRIIEFIAVGKMKGDISGSIILLCGPPGVGKTSIGRSIAKALNREFYRFSVGGMRDEAEIKGHRRTYIGAMPGKMIQAVKETGTANPVIMLDEIDKITSSYQGDPASALLEVLDPEQNCSFLDHYLDVRFDLSKVLFVCTANQLDTIPGPLRDRMEILRLSGYIAEEKVSIAKTHLWPRLLTKHGLTKQQLRIHQSAIKMIVEQYAREAGVRNLEKLLAKIIRKATVRLLKCKKPIAITKKNLVKYLGNPIFQTEAPQTGVGIVTGLAWTSMGGATLDIEVSTVFSKRQGFKLTGQMGGVMKESAEIAYSFILGNLHRYHEDDEFFHNKTIHLHIPQGATPKDGPSAGITMSCAMLSLAMNRSLKRGFAMSGEITLTGQVLVVGGIREKVVAAKRVNIKTLILPLGCQADYETLPAHIQAGMTVYFVEHFDQVVELVF